MISNFDKRLDSLRRLREKHQFGISLPPGSPEVEKQELQQYTRTPNPEIILDHISTLPKFDLREEFDPGSSSIDELEARCRDLKYRASWLEALLHITNEELRFVTGALQTKQGKADSNNKASLS